MASSTWTEKHRRITEGEKSVYTLTICWFLSFKINWEFKKSAFQNHWNFPLCTSSSRTCFYYSSKTVSAGIPQVVRSVEWHSPSPSGWFQESTSCALWPKEVKPPNFCTVEKDKFRMLGNLSKTEKRQTVLAWRRKVIWIQDVLVRSSWQRRKYSKYNFTWERHQSLFPKMKVNCVLKWTFAVSYISKPRWHQSNK